MCTSLFVRPFTSVWVWAAEVGRRGCKRAMASPVDFPSVMKALYSCRTVLISWICMKLLIQKCLRDSVRACGGTAKNSRNLG